jgi:hypothetical protein
VGPDGKLIFCSTLYKFEAKLFNWLYSMGNRVKKLFSHFRLPKLADHQLLQKQASSLALPSSVEMLLIREKDGQVRGWNPRAGEFIER